MRELTFKKRLGRALTPGLHLLFRILQPLGLHLVRNHFYEPIPDTRQLPEALWRSGSAMVGVDLREEAQLHLLNEVFPRFADECAFPWASTGQPDEFHLDNEYFRTFDAEVLHCLIRHFRPRTVVEIGSGHSTLLAARAARLNRERDGVPTRLVAIEPYPDPILRRGFPGLDELIERPVEAVPLDLFRSLGENDIVFIDSSHVVKIGGDVLYEYLEILPRLALGVLVHVHDIFLPDHYPRQWVIDEHKFWNEQYLLHAFLCFNSEFEVIWGSTFMSARHAPRLQRTFPAWAASMGQLADPGGTPSGDGPNNWPSSFWIRRKPHSPQPPAD